jgi:hypothetical protein
VRTMKSRSPGGKDAGSCLWISSRIPDRSGRRSTTGDSNAEAISTKVCNNGFCRPFSMLVKEVLERPTLVAIASCVKPFLIRAALIFIPTAR